MALKHGVSESRTGKRWLYRDSLHPYLPYITVSAVSQTVVTSDIAVVWERHKQENIIDLR